MARVQHSLTDTEPACLPACLPASVSVCPSVCLTLSRSLSLSLSLLSRLSGSLSLSLSLSVCVSYAWYTARDEPTGDTNSGNLLVWNDSNPTLTSTGVVYKAMQALVRRCKQLRF